MSRTLPPACRPGRTAGLLASLAFTLAMSAAGAKPPVADSTPARLPTPAEEAALRERLRAESLDALAGGGAAAIAGERAALRAVGQSPDDPVAVAAWRANEAEREGPAVNAAGDFMLDTRWGNAGIAPDRYAGSNDGTYRGIQSAMLPGGVQVVVGEVQYPGGNRQLGITKRDTSGTRIAWSGVAPPYSAYGGQYILWPFNDAAAPEVFSVHDVRVRSNRIYALATVRLTSPLTYAPAVVCFDANGASCGWWFAYYSAGSVVNDAVAMDILGDRLVVLGRHSLGESGGFWTVKWSIASDGSLVDPTFGNFPAPAGQARAEPVDIAFRRVGVLPPPNPGYYVLYSRKFSSNAEDVDYDPCLLGVTAAHEPDTSFGGAGVRCKPFDRPDSGRTDRAVALVTLGWQDFAPLTVHEGVQVLVSVARSSRPGIGVWSLLDRVDQSSFGALGGDSHGLGGGRMLFGGCEGGVGEGCSVLPPIGHNAHMPADLAIVGDDIAIVGYRYGPGLVIGGNDTETPLFARVDRGTGALLQLATFPSGYSQGRFNGIGVRDTQHVVGVGEAIDASIAATTARTQIQVGLTSDDTIFRDGFD
ncbi:hypothetical protein [Dokdonella fugitiva]|uniref:hypothetical protein n=1 Tax=Dokdonella fugitiva TaxID=328517 RepID=UPI0015FBD4D6|nr:hypothetical protein [Dokdonella fugitiva]MBA8883660.1 hypothetical protein [Dokdonella fugitiva]